MPNITFCINTSVNERHYLELLLRSLDKNLSRKDYPIIVYIENDNQDTMGYLQSVAKKMFPNLTIIKNPLPIPLSCARNINIMFDMAKTEIVSYLQSDMVICPDYDLEITKFLTPDTVISATRIEPSLHDGSSEKITHDLGIDPIRFDLDTFSKFSNLYKADKTINFWFAPFTMYKSAWKKVGGYDTLFRRSRDDSDLLYRFLRFGLKVKQACNAIVYHFTCISSRGPEWWTEKGKERTKLQKYADQMEVRKFIRKWGKFRHPTTPEEVKDDYLYRISANLYNVLPNDIFILMNYFFFSRIYVDDSNARKFLKEKFEKNFEEAANELCAITPDQWNLYKKYYRVWEYSDIFSESPLSDDVIYNIDLKGKSMSTVAQTDPMLNRQELVHTYRSESPGEFEIDNSGITIILNNPVNRIQENLLVINPPIDDIKLILL